MAAVARWGTAGRILQPGSGREGWSFLGRLVNAAGVLIGGGWLLALLVPQCKIISMPGPIEYNEPAVWQATWLLDHGRNPYTEQELPGAAYCFGPLYNYVVLAFKPLLGIDYSAHRMISLVFLAGSLWLIVRLMRKAGTGLGIALMTAALYYWMSLLNIEVTARPDTLGLFFFLLGIFVPWEHHYSRKASILGLGCALVAFHCKYYFAVAGCATLLGVFLVRSRRESCWLALGYFSALILSFLAFWWHYPFLYLETIVVQRGASILNSRQDISDMHTVMFFTRAWPFLLLLGYGLANWLWGRHLARRLAGTGAAAAAAPGEARIHVLGTVFVIFLGLVYFYMGRNAGALFTYHLHLLFPVMFVLAAPVAARPGIRTGFGLLLAAFVTGLLAVPVVADSDAPYRRLEQLIYASHGEVLGIPCVTDILDRTGRPVVHDANSMFLGFALGNNRASWDPMAAAVAQRTNEVTREVESKVAARSYDLVFTEFDEPMYCSTELLEQNYEKVEQVDYYTYFGHSPVRVWRSKTRLKAGGDAPR